MHGTRRRALCDVLNVQLKIYTHSKAVLPYRGYLRPSGGLCLVDLLG